ncbi:ABC-2 type transport system permease protein [Pseudochelatococcus lubricantis]|uniref:ABC-2 type transport system permease protein n=1 Tax=Pseudochelatococcus lubricantis TaxID=1538102 RepID=A0ABX0V5B8_9HYPH|nr:ABC transporter permease [Pseudochelatococcus lubricantis]NIJ59699.1 ABC-2 type transport system permease protein [Pseudochelatococcus lubricantis]
MTPTPPAPAGTSPSSAGFSFRRLTALCVKETRQIVRDPSSLLIAIVLPVVLLFIFGFGISLDTNRLAVGVVMEDRGVEAVRLAAAAAGSPYIEPVFADTLAEISEKLTRGELRGIIVIPQDFTAKVQAGGGEASLQVLTDGSEPNTANFVASYARGLYESWLAARADAYGVPFSEAISIEPRYWFNPATISRNYLIPGSISVVMTIIGALLTSLVVAREWERGTMEALLATPMRRAELLLSKSLPYYVLAMLAMAICVLIAVFIMNVPFRGSIAILLLSTSLFLGSALGLGLLLSTTTRNQFNAAQGALNAAFLPSALLSGLIFEIASMPAAVQAVTYLVPARYFVKIMQTLFQAGDVWAILLPNMLFLLVSSIFWLGLTTWRTRRRLDG